MHYIKILIYVSLRCFPKSKFIFNLDEIKQNYINNNQEAKKKYNRLIYLVYSFFIFLLNVLSKLKISKIESKIIELHIRIYNLESVEIDKQKIFFDKILNLIKSNKINSIKYKTARNIVNFLINLNELIVAENFLLHLIKSDKNNFKLKIDLAELYIIKSLSAKDLVSTELISKSKNLLSETNNFNHEDERKLKLSSEINFLQGSENSSFLKHYEYLNFIRSKNLDSNEKKFYPILLISPPRTSATFIYSTLVKKFNKKLVPVGDPFYKFKNALLDKNKLVKFASTNNSICHSHIDAEKINLDLIKLCLEKITVNFRDPRQELVSIIKSKMYSWAHDPLSFYQTADQRPADYLNYSFMQKILYEINDSNGYFTNIIDYINGWLRIEKNSDYPTKILFTVQEKLKENPSNFFNSILKFYEVDKQYFFNQNEKYFSKKDKSDRDGPLAEWKTLPNEIIQEMNKKIPEEFFKRLLWEK